MNPICETELTKPQVLDVVRNSSGSDWLYFKQHDIFSFKRDLLIRLEPADRSSLTRLRVFYGNDEQTPFPAEATLNWRESKGILALDLALQGPINVKLSGIQVVDEPDPARAILEF